jgi:excisionase family DNA binding protein
MSNEKILVMISKSELEDIIKSSIQQSQVPESVSTKEENNSFPELISISDVCRILKKSRTTLHKMRKDKDIPYCQINGRVLFKKEDVLSFIENNYIKQNHLPKGR